MDNRVFGGFRDGWGGVREGEMGRWGNGEMGKWGSRGRQIVVLASCSLVSSEQDARTTFNSELLTPNSELRTPNSELRTPNSELRTPNSELLIRRIPKIIFVWVNVRTRNCRYSHWTRCFGFDWFFGKIFVFFKCL